MLVGPERFYMGVSEGERRLVTAILDILQRGPARTPSLREVEQCHAVLVLGEDVTNVAPRLALALRQSVRQQPLQIAQRLRIPLWNDAAVREAIGASKGPLFLAAPCATKLAEVATLTYRAAPDDIARLGFAVAHALNAEAPAVTDLPSEVQTLVKGIAAALQGAKRPLVVAGASLGYEPLIQAAANVACVLHRSDRPAALCYSVPECNSLGLALMGGGSLEAAFKAVDDGAAEAAIVVENDLYRRGDSETVNAFFEGCRHVIAIDHLAHATAERAEIVLPAGTFAEANGTLVSSEGRAQRFFQVFVPDGQIQESWRWLRDIMVAVGMDELNAWQNLDDVLDAMIEAIPSLARISEVAPSADFRVAGQKIPRQPPRYSGRTAMLAQRTVHEPKPPDDPDAPLSFSMEGYRGQPPPSLIPFFWAPGWNSSQAVNKFQSEVAGPLVGGNPGLRLIEPPAGGEVAYFDGVPTAFARREAEWLLVPVYHIFDAEELSTLSPAVAERVPQPYLALHPDDAAGLRLAGGAFRLPGRVEASLPRGVAGLPVGLPGVPWLRLPAWVQLSRGA